MAEPSPPEKTSTAAGARSISALDYNAFIAGLELVQIRLAAAHIDAPNPPERRPVAPVLNVDDATYRNGDDHFVVRQTLAFTGTYEGEDEPALRVRVTFEVRYTADERMTDPLFSEFRSRNLPVNTWPYLREYLQSTLGRTGWPVLTLPAYKTAPSTTAAELDDIEAGEH
jgi:hypothetical protein